MIKFQIIKILLVSIIGIAIIFVFTFFFISNNSYNNKNKVCVTKENFDFCGTKKSSSIGKQIFNENCTACHKLNNFDDIIKRRYTTYKDSTYFEGYIKNEDSLIAVGNRKVKLVNELFEGDFNHNFNSISKKDIQELKIYIESFMIN